MATSSPAEYQAAMKRALELATRVRAQVQTPKWAASCWIRLTPSSLRAGMRALEPRMQKSWRSRTSLTLVSPLRSDCRGDPGTVRSHRQDRSLCRGSTERRIARVVYAVSDPGAASGGGAELLSAAGVEVIAGVEASSGEALVERWLHSVTASRPWVTLKWAMSLDGRTAAADGTSQWITGEETRAKVHRDRSEHDAIIVGINTVLVDNPRLTARTPEGDLYPHQPLAIVMGHRDVPQDALIREHPGGFEHVNDHDVQALLTSLGERDIRSVYVEGGATLASAFLAEGLVDELHITMGPMLLGDPTSPSPTLVYQQWPTPTTCPLPTSNAWVRTLSSPHDLNRKGASDVHWAHRRNWLHYLPRGQR
jgi:riboflavin biosynthesis pyrimidine reductase